MPCRAQLQRVQTRLLQNADEKAGLRLPVRTVRTVVNT